MSTPAPSLEVLFDPEEAAETAWKTILTARDVPSFIQREFKNLPDKRVDIQLSLGSYTGHRHRDRTGRAWLDAWNYRLKLSIITPIDDQEPTSHGLFRAKVRIAAQYASGMLDDVALLPYHTFTSIIEGGTSPSVVTADDSDFSEILFNGILSIRSGAWPVV